MLSSVALLSYIAPAWSTLYVVKTSHHGVIRVVHPESTFYVICWESSLGISTFGIMMTCPFMPCLSVSVLFD